MKYRTTINSNCLINNRNKKKNENYEERKFSISIFLLDFIVAKS